MVVLSALIWRVVYSCRLTPKTLFVYYTTFFAPLCLIIICNTAIFIKVVSVICRKRPDFVNVPGKNSKTSTLDVRRVQVHGSLAVMFLLGITWIFGGLAISHARLTFQYVFCITNSLQGFLIFIFRCVERREARNAWLHFCKTGERRLVSGSYKSTSRSEMVSGRRDTERISPKGHGSTKSAPKHLWCRTSGNVFGEAMLFSRNCAMDRIRYDVVSNLDYFCNFSRITDGKADVLGIVLHVMPGSDCNTFSTNFVRCFPTRFMFHRKKLASTAVTARKSHEILRENNLSHIDSTDFRSIAFDRCWAFYTGSIKQKLLLRARDFRRSGVSVVIPGLESHFWRGNRARKNRIKRHPKSR